MDAILFSEGIKQAAKWLFIILINGLTQLSRKPQAISLREHAPPREGY